MSPLFPNPYNITSRAPYPVCPVPEPHTLIPSSPLPFSQVRQPFPLPVLDAVDLERLRKWKEGRYVLPTHVVYSRVPISHSPISPISSLTRFFLYNRTGMPIVDANMRELAATGYMSSRGRLNCAAFLVHALEVQPPS